MFKDAPGICQEARMLLEMLRVAGGQFKRVPQVKKKVTGFATKRK